MLACEQAKKELSTEFETTIRVEGLIQGHPQYEDLDFARPITRDEFEEAASEVFERLLEPLQAALDEAEMTAEEIDDVVIVGGSTRIPKVKQMLKEFFSKEELFETLDADEGVAYGAAVMAGQLGNQVYVT